MNSVDSFEAASVQDYLFYSNYVHDSCTRELGGASAVLHASHGETAGNWLSSCMRFADPGVNTGGIKISEAFDLDVHHNAFVDNRWWGAILRSQTIPADILLRDNYFGGNGHFAVKLEDWETTLTLSGNDYHLSATAAPSTSTNGWAEAETDWRVDEFVVGMSGGVVTLSGSDAAAWEAALFDASAATITIE